MISRPLSVLGANEISKGLWLLVCVTVVSMSVSIVGVGIFLWADIVHLQHIATFRASLNWALAGHLCFTISFNTNQTRLERTYREPNNVVRVGGKTSAPSILLVAERLDDNWVIKRACNPPSAIDLPRPSISPIQLWADFEHT